MKNLAAVLSLMTLLACGRPMTVELSQPKLRIPVGGSASLQVTVRDAPEAPGYTLTSAPLGLTFSPSKLAQTNEPQTVTITAPSTFGGGGAITEFLVTAGGGSAFAPLELEFIDSHAFSFLLTPQPLTVRSGSTAMLGFTIHSNPKGPTAGIVDVSVVGARPDGVTFDTAKVMLTDGAATGQLKVTASAAAKAATVSLRLHAVELDSEADTDLQLTVLDATSPDFALEAPATLKARHGGMATLSVKVDALRGFSQPVALSATAPAGVTVTPATAAAGDTALLQISVGAQVMTGMLPLVVHAVGGGIAHDAPVMLAVTDSGAIDAAFGTAGLAPIPMLGTPAQLTRLLVLPDGKLLALGANAAGAIAVRFNEDGAVDTAFGQQGIAVAHAGDQAAAIAAVAGENGAVFIGTTWFDMAGLEYVAMLTKLNADGTIDTTFADQGTFVSPLSAFFYDVTKLSDGGFLITSTELSFSMTSFSLGAAFTRVTAAGAVDTSFGTGGSWKLADHFAATALELEGGAIAVMASRFDTSKYVEPKVIRLTSAGAVDPSFGAAGTAVLSTGMPNEMGFALAKRPDGSIVAVAEGYPDKSSVADTKSFVFQLTPQGTLDASFGMAGRAELGAMSGAVALAADGSLVLGGCVQAGLDGTSAVLERFDARGHVDPGFIDVPVLPGENGCVSSVGLQPSGRIIAAGNKGTPMATGAGWFITRVQP